MFYHGPRGTRYGPIRLLKSTMQWSRHISTDLTIYQMKETFFSSFSAVSVLAYLTVIFSSFNFVFVSIVIVQNVHFKEMTCLVIQRINNEFEFLFAVVNVVIIYGSNKHSLLSLLLIFMVQINICRCQRFAT